MANHVRHLEGEKVNHLMPDLISHGKKIIMESKARRFNKSFNLRDDQLKKYETLQAEYHGFNMYWALYSHLVSSTRESRESKDELFKKLASKTLCSIVLPFDLVLELNKCRDPSLVSRFEGGDGARAKYDVATIPTQKTMALLYHRPEFLIELLGLKSNDYQINRLVSPNSFHIGENKVKKFPILNINKIKLAES